MIQNVVTGYGRGKGGEKVVLLLYLDILNGIRRSGRDGSIDSEEIKDWTEQEF